MNIYRERMQNVVRANRECPQPEKFTMQNYFHQCGTPACAFGNYVARTDLQSDFLPGRKHYEWLPCDAPNIADHFGINAVERWELFGTKGCNNAQTPDQAADYIEAFIERKWPLRKVVKVPEVVMTRAELEVA